MRRAEILHGEDIHRHIGIVGMLGRAAASGGNHSRDRIRSAVVIFGDIALRRAPAADTCMRITLGCKQIHTVLGRVGTSRSPAGNAAHHPDSFRCHLLIAGHTWMPACCRRDEITWRDRRARPLSWSFGSPYRRDVRRSRSATYPCTRLTHRVGCIGNRPIQENPSQPLLPTINAFVCGYPNHPACPARP
jgi:hypothetical protein